MIDGAGRMVIIYTIAGVAGFALSSFAAAYVPPLLILRGGSFSVGASASIFGLLGALVYFTDPEDLIPDSVPGLGFLDDAIYVELIIRELKAEIDSYEEFCAFPTAGGKRRIG